MSLKPEQNYLKNQRLVTIFKKMRSSWIPYTLVILLCVSHIFIEVIQQYEEYLTIDQNNVLIFSRWIKSQLDFGRLIFSNIPYMVILLLYYWCAISLCIFIFQSRIENYHIQNNIEAATVSPKTSDDPKVLELKLKQVRSWRKAWLVYVTILLISTSLIYKFGANGWYSVELLQFFESPERYPFVSFFFEFISDVALLVIPLSAVYALILYLIETNIHTRLTKLANGIEAMENEIRIQQVSEDIYKHSIKMSYEYLNQYYEQTRKQAENGFRITMNVAIGGGIIIALGILAMFLGQMEPAYITTATGVIIEFIASIFFYLYNRTMQNMGDYHNKLVLSQNIAIALEVVKDIEGEEQNNVKSHMVKELIRDINTHINENKPERKSDSVEHPKPQPAENDA